MFDIGYRFENEAAVLKILSYSNHHPGLIQYLCDELLKGLQSGILPEWPPFEISNKAVKDLYARADTKQAIERRFSWTINLDPLFSAIIWKIVDDQLDSRSTDSVKHRIPDLLEKVRLFWPAAFDRMTEERLRGLLDDLCGLGILFRRDDGYQLRNPNISEIIGTPEEIRGRLLDLEDQPAPQSSIDADHHRQLMRGTNRRSPFTLAQMSQLLKRSFGVGLIMGSDALGLPDVEKSFREGFERTRDPDAQVEVRRVLVKAKQADHWKLALEEIQAKAGKTPRIVLVVDTEEFSDLVTIVEQSLEFCQPRRKA
ncbi:MAG: hypothetical protein ABI614_08530, partial [Planctomycetota bacterium]